MDSPDPFFDPEAPTLDFDVSGQLAFTTSGGCFGDREQADRLAIGIVSMSGLDVAPEDALCTSAVLSIVPAKSLTSLADLASPIADLLRPPVLYAFDVSTKLSVSGREFSRDSWVPPDQLASTLRSVAVRRLNEALGVVCACGALASPGLGYFYAEFPHERSDWFDAARAHNLSSLGFTVERLGWPRFRELSMRDIHRWVLGLDGWVDGVGHGRAGRAFAALTQILGAPEAGSYGDDLTHATAGLEALFASGRYRRMAQVVDGAQRLLGPSPEAAAEFAANYNHRSQLVHGELALPFYFRERGNYEQMRTVWDADEARRLSIAMLVASLQELVVRGVYTI